MRRLALSSLLLALTACGGAAPAPALTPTSPQVPTTPGTAPSSGPPAPAGDPFAVEGPLQEQWLPLLKPPVFDLKTLPFPPPAAGTPAAPAACSAFAAKPKPHKCKD